MAIKTFTWHRDSHGLFDYETKNLASTSIKCNYSSKAESDLSVAILYRFDNDIIFEEHKPQDKLPSDPAAVIL